MAGIRTSLALVVASSLAACSTFQPPDANGPRANARPYPIVAAAADITPSARLAWKNLSTVRAGVATAGEPSFNPITGTIESLPANGTTHVSLPRVGGGPTQTEEEIRESLRRFINDWHEVIGAIPAQLSLIERVDEPSGLRVARYEQRPFRLPLRGGFGQLVIRFRNDGEVVQLSSNCIPNTDALQPALAALSPKVSPDETAAHLAGRAITVTDGNGRTQSFTFAAGTQFEVQQPVVYALPSADKLSLELHLAWEISSPNGAIKTIYLDAITDEVIAAN